jgi:hypothetical protein
MKTYYIILCGYIKKLSERKTKSGCHAPLPMLVKDTISAMPAAFPLTARVLEFGSSHLLGQLDAPHTQIF